MKNYLAVDLGATSGRTVLASYDGERIDMQVWTRFENPQLPMTGHIFWNLPHLYNEILRALRKLRTEGVSIESIGIDTWGCDVAFFGRAGNLLALPLCYRDPFTDGIIDRYMRRHINADALYERTGIQFMPFNTLFQLSAMRREGFSVMQKPETLLFMPDALIYLLTGQCICEQTVTSTSQLLNPHTGDLDPRLLSTVGLMRKNFGPMTKPGTIAGVLTQQIQQATGIGEVPVAVVAGHDTASAVVSVPAEDANYAYLSCGTWSLLGIESPTPIINKESQALNFTNEGGIDGTTRFLKNICGLWLFERCREEWDDVPQDVNELNALATTTDFDSLIFPDHPSFAHPESMTRAIVDYCRRTGQAEPKTPAEFVRCIFRSLAMRYRQVIGYLRDLSTVDIQRLHVIGGGSRNAVLMQMAADATGLPVVAGPQEGTALGNVLLQLRADGEVETLADMRHISAESVDTVTYEPQPAAAWELGYQRFCKLQ